MATTPPDRPGRPETSIRDALAAAARRKAASPRAKWVVWGVLGGTVVAIGVAQMAGWTKSPVAERVLEDRRRRGDMPGATSKRDVVLEAAGDRRVDVIKAVREATRLGLADAQALVDAAPRAVATGVTPEEAERIRRLLEAAGATVKVR